MSRAEAYAAYVDADGNPRLRPSCVLFFDLLGISAMATSDDSLAYLRDLKPALEAAIDRAMTEDERFTQASTWFTDNGVVGAPVLHDRFIESIVGGAEVAAAYLMLVCWGRGFLGRGSITLGDHYMDEKLVFGPALIEAVNLEKRARWPRVVLSDAAIESETRQSRSYAHPLHSAQNACLVRDGEGTVFVDHLGIYLDEEDDEAVLDHFLRQLKTATMTGLASHRPWTEPWLKWRWLADYQNHTLLRLSDPAPYLVAVSEQRAMFGDFLDPSWETQPGSPWYAMDRQDRYRLEPFDDGWVPSMPGVFALYRDGMRLYAQSTKSLKAQVWRNHATTDRRLEGSGLASAIAIHLGLSDWPSQEALRAVREWLDGCRFAWIECETLSDANALRVELLAQETLLLN